MDKEIAEKLMELAPQVAFTATRERDESVVWDGDGPDPEEQGLRPYIVIVKAVGVTEGKLVEGLAYLSGSYFADDEPIGDVHGYLLGMLQEAALDLQKIIKNSRIWIDLEEVITYLKEESQRRYDAQRAEIEGQGT